MKRMIVMGVSGAGKTTLGRELARALEWQFLDADDFHTPAAKAKIAGGTMLDEEDRAGWLAALRPALDAPPLSKVLACSALKAVHRQTLAPETLVHIVITPDLALERLANRQGHFAGPSIAASQFATLEAPDDAICVPADWSTEDQVAFILEHLQRA
jgi:gluconokinase